MNPQLFSAYQDLPDNDKQELPMGESFKMT
jgi:hypothetical protein